MLHTVILAHPNADSFTAEVARTYARTVEALGHQTDLRDLYRMNFDPCLKADEIPGAETRGPHQDVRVERARIAAADVYALIYPLWFNAPPAILKGYVDRVFSHGFGYEAEFGGNRPLLAGKQLISVSVSGAPSEWVRDSGAADALQTLFDRHLCATTGLTFAGHHFIGGVTPGIREDVGQRLLEGVADEVRHRFGEAAVAAA